MKSRTSISFCHKPGVKPFQPATSWCVASCLVAIVIVVFSLWLCSDGGVSQLEKLAGVPCDHHFLVRRHYPYRNLALRRRNSCFVRFVGTVTQRDAEPGGCFANSPACVR